MDVTVNISKEELSQLDCTREELEDGVRKALEGGFDLGDGQAYPTSVPTTVVVQD